MVKESAIESIKKFVKLLEKENIKVDKVILYGSCVNNIQRLESDIDIAIVSRDFGKDRIEEGMKLFRLAGEIDPRLEPVPISLESFKKDTWIPLIYEIKTKGKEIKIK